MAIYRSFLAMIIIGLPMATCMAQTCSRAAGSPMQMQVRLAIEERASSDKDTDKIGMAKADNDPSRPASNANSRSTTFTPDMGIRVELQDEFGGSLRDAAPSDQGKVAFSVCSQSTYRIHVVGPEIEEVTAENLVPGLGDSMVNLTLHLVPTDQTRVKQVGGVVAANRLNIPKSAQKELESGNTALAAGHALEARQHFEKAIAEYPEFDQAYNNLGVALMQLGKSQEGKAAFEHAIKINEHFARALTNLARIALDEKQYNEAFALVQRSLSSEPMNVKSLFLGVEAAYAANKLDETIAYALRLHTFPHAGMGLAHFFCARSMEKAGALHEALAQYQMFIQEEPNDPNVPKAQMAIAELSSAVPSHQ